MSRLSGIALVAIAVLVPVVVNGQGSKEQLAQYHFNNGEFRQAIEIAEPLYKKTNNKYYYQMLYRSYMALENYKEAERLVEGRMKKAPSELYLYVDLGKIAAVKKDAKKKQKAYDEALGKMKYDQRQITELVDAFVAANEYDYAARCYLKARELTKNKFLYFNELASIYGATGNYEAMTKEYLDLLEGSPGSMNSVQVSLQRNLSQATGTELADGLRRALVSKIQKEPSNQTWLQMMIWFSMQEKDFEFAMTQAKAVDARFPENGGELVLKVSDIAKANENYEVAEQGYNHLLKKGTEGPLYPTALVGLLNVKWLKVDRNYSMTPKEYKSLKADYEKAITSLGKTVETVQLMRNYAQLTAYYGNEVQTAADMLYDALEIPKLPASQASEVKLELGDLMLFAGEIWDASLLYMQVEKANKNDMIGAQAKLRNARLSYFTNEFEWAKSQLEVLRSATSKLIANDAMELSLLISDNLEDDSTYTMLELYAAADLLLYRNMLDSAWKAFDNIEHRTLSHTILDDVLMQKAKIRLKQGRYSEADELLQKLINFYGDGLLGDDALMMSAELNENHLGNKKRAKEQYEKILLEHPTSLYTEQSRKRYDKLKKE